MNKNNDTLVISGFYIENKVSDNLHHTYCFQHGIYFSFDEKCHRCVTEAREKSNSGALAITSRGR